MKFADLSVAHDSEYVFDLNRMTALTGSTGPYLQYAVTRIRSILRSASTAPTGRVSVAAPEERALALTLLDFGDVVLEVGTSLEPHRLCTYLIEVAQSFSSFYERCPVLKAEEPTRQGRLALCGLALGVLESGLCLLGIEAPERM